MSVRRDTNLHPTTVSAASTGEVGPLPQRKSRRPGTFNSPVARASVPDVLVAAAVEAAGGDTTRLYFAQGDVWVLNHRRGERCVSPACPACR